MLIDKPRCNFKNCRFYFDGNCRSADIYENCKLTDLHSEIAKLRIDLDNAKAEVESIFNELMKEAREIADRYEKSANETSDYGFARIEYRGTQLGALLVLFKIAELKKKYTEERT